MATIYDVLAHVRGRMPHLVEPMKALKLAYYAQAWHATWQGAALYPEPTEAWEHGPVCREGWKALKYGTFVVPRALQPGEAAVVDAVIDFYGGMSGWQLRKLSHDEGPWQEARGDLPEWAPSTEEVTVASMRRYYTRKSLSGESVPQRAASPTEAPSHEEAMRVAREQMKRWQGALDLLADR